MIRPYRLYGEGISNNTCFWIMLITFFQVELKVFPTLLEIDLTIGQSAYGSRKDKEITFNKIAMIRKHLQEMREELKSKVTPALAMGDPESNQD